MAKSSPEQREKWKQRILDQQKSKVPIVEFCRQNNLTVHQFYYFRNQLFPSQRKSPNLVEVKTIPETHGPAKMNIYLNEISITLEGHYDAGFLADFCLKLDRQQ